MSLLRSAKTTYLGLASRAGAFGMIARSEWRRQRLLILAYHGYALDDEHEWSPTLYMSPAHLRDRFQAIRETGCTVLPLPEAVRRLREGSLPDLAVAITVDDGNYDFHVGFVPLLQEFGYHATLYASTYYSGTGMPVFNTMLRYLTWKAMPQVIDGAGLSGLPRLDLRSQSGREQAAEAIREHTVTHELSARAKEDLLQLLAERTRIDYAALLDRRLLQLMGPSEFATLPRDLVSVQLHTHRHRVPVDRAAFHREIADNRRALSSLLDVAPETLVDFCYPSGHTHPHFPGWLAECGVTTATTCLPSLASATDDPRLLPRFVDTTPCSDLEFQAWLTGAAAFTPRRRQVLTAAPGS